MEQNLAKIREYISSFFISTRTIITSLYDGSVDYVIEDATSGSPLYYQHFAPKSFDCDINAMGSTENIQNYELRLVVNDMFNLDRQMAEYNAQERAAKLDS